MAGILYKLGIFMGERLLPASPMNEMGFYQDIDFEELFDDLQLMLPTLNDPPGHPRLQRLRALVETRCAMGVDFGIKISRLAHVLPEFMAACTHPIKIITTKRDISHSIASWRRWSEPHDQDPTEYISNSAFAIEEALKNVKTPILEVDYVQLIKNPHEQIEIICQYVGRPVTHEALDFVNPSMCHYMESF